MRQDLPRAVIAGLWSMAIYATFLHLSLYFLDIAWISLPNFLFWYWVVFPGACLLSLVVLRNARGSIAKGALMGGVLAPLNGPFSVLVAIVAWHLGAKIGLLEPWKYGFSGLWGQWLHDLPLILLFSAPLAVPAGFLLGAWLVRPASKR